MRGCFPKSTENAVSGSALFALHGIEEKRKRARSHQVVGVHHKDIGCASDVCSDVAGISQAGVETFPDKTHWPSHPILSAAGAFPRIVGRCVIDDDYLDRHGEHISGTIDRIDTAFDEGSVIVESDKD